MVISCSNPWPLALSVASRWSPRRSHQRRPRDSWRNSTADVWGTPKKSVDWWLIIVDYWWLVSDVDDVDVDVDVVDDDDDDGDGDGDDDDDKISKQNQNGKDWTKMKWFPNTKLTNWERMERNLLPCCGVPTDRLPIVHEPMPAMPAMPLPVSQHPLGTTLPGRAVETWHQKCIN